MTGDGIPALLRAEGILRRVEDGFAVQTFSFIAGVLCVLSALLDAFQTIILPRRATGRFRLTRLFYVFTWTPWSAIASRIQHPRKRETALSFYGPLSLVFLIVFWAAALVIGFSLMYYGWARISPIRWA